MRISYEHIFNIFLLEDNFYKRKSAHSENPQHMCARCIEVMVPYQTASEFHKIIIAELGLASRLEANHELSLLIQTIWLL
jgi:hypothetical protein